MIFNPMFFSENGNATAVVAKPNKLSNNKYLFSDIVKVVMTPEREQKKLLEKNIENIINPELKIVPGAEQNPEQLKLKFLNDQETEKVKLELADILPADIAQLLIDDEAIIKENKAVSYLSKEPLNSDLQLFLNGLVGEELIKKTISTDTGVFLSLEDTKSAVNIELTQELSNQKSQGKIIVQTLVIPEKSKLISLLNNIDKNSLLIPDKQNIKSINTNSPTILKSNSENNIVSKPTLSVYSFKSNSVYSDFKNGLVELSETNNNINILKNISNTKSEKYASTNNSLLEKISFVPRDYKDKNIETKNLKFIKSDAQIKVNNKVVKTDFNNKNYNISKITILKKQDNIADTFSKEVSSKQIDSPLRKINFDYNTNNQKTDLHLLRKENTEGPKVKYSKTSSSGSKDIGIIQTTEYTKQTKINDNVAKNSVSDANGEKIKTIENDSYNNLVQNKSTAKNLSNETSTSKDTNKVQPDKNVKIYSTNSNPEKIEKNIKQKKSDQLNPKEETKKFSKSNDIQNELKETKVEENVKVKTANKEVKSDTDIRDPKKNIISDKSIKSEKIETSNKINSEEKQTDKGSVNNQDDKSNKIKSLNSEQITDKKAVTDSQVKVDNKKVESKGNIGIKQNDTHTTKIENSVSENKTVKTSFEAEKKEVVNNKSELKEPISLNKFVKEEKIDDTAQIKEKTVSDNKKSVNNLQQTNEKGIKTGDHKELSAHKNVQQESNKEHKNEKVIANELTGILAEEKPVKPNNKKISVKVKGGVKKVSENNKSGSENTSIKNNTEQSHNNSTESSLNENNPSGLNTKEHANIKSINEHNFNNVLHQEAVKSQDVQITPIQSSNTSANQRVIKSIEVIKEISRFIAQKDNGTFSFKIEPEHLGKMKITLDTIDNLLKATIEVDNEQSKQMIERNINKLHSQLSESGIELNSLNISLGYSKNQKNDEEISDSKTKQSKNNSQVGETEENLNKKNH